MASEPLEQGVDLEHTGAFQALEQVEDSQFHPVSLSWIDLNFKVTVGSGRKKKEKTILHNISGYAPPGTFFAIMGPTGSGKTSLLNVLAGRVLRGAARLEGQVLANGQPRDSSFKRLCAYVMQDDVMFHTLTVWETLMAAALLRLPQSTPSATKKQIAESIINQLGLAKARDTRIGNELARGISGGERKRTAIAVEMLSNPVLIFLDEPTSGLDSFQAMNVMSTMSELAKSGRTVISTIHQPRSSIFQLFEYLILLSEGQPIYCGKASGAVDYFSSRGMPCPDHFNPADFFMDQISPDRRDAKREQESLDRIAMLAKNYVVEADVDPLQNKSALMLGGGAEALPRAPRTTYASSWPLQFAVLYARSLRQVTRDRLPLAISFVQAIVMSLVVGSLYSDIKLDQKGVQDRKGVIFFISVFVAFGGIFQIITTFPIERALVNRERAANSYRLSAYYPAKVVSEWPIRILPTLIFITIVYWIVGLNHNASRFFLFLLTAVLEFSSMMATGLLASSIAPTPQTAIGLAPLFTVVFMLFGGFFINLESIPVWLRWFQRVSPIQWGFIAFAVNEFRGVEFKCSSTDKSCFQTGEQVLENLSVSQWKVATALGYQALVCACIHVIAFTVLSLNRPRLQPLNKLTSSKPTSKEASQALPSGVMQVPSTGPPS